MTSLVVGNFGFARPLFADSGFQTTVSPFIECSTVRP